MLKSTKAGLRKSTRVCHNECMREVGADSHVDGCLSSGIFNVKIPSTPHTLNIALTQEGKDDSDPCLHLLTS